MKTVTDAVDLAQVMVDIGTGSGRETVALISSMEEPLGTAIGNSLEVTEAIEVLSGGGDTRLRDFCVVLAVKMLMLADPLLEATAATATIQSLLEKGAGLKKFQEFIEAQGGDGQITTELFLLGRAAKNLELRANGTGYIVRMDSAELGRAAILLGAGRAKKDDAIDLTAGIKLHRRCGAYVAEGELLATLFFGEQINPMEAKRIVTAAIHLASEPPPRRSLIAGMVDKAGWHEKTSDVIWA